MNKKNVMSFVRRRVKEAGSQKAYADKIYVSEQYLCDILKGRRELSDNFLEKIGIVKTEHYYFK